MVSWIKKIAEIVVISNSYKFTLDVFTFKFSEIFVKETWFGKTKVYPMPSSI